MSQSLSGDGNRGDIWWGLSKVQQSFLGRVLLPGSRHGVLPSLAAISEEVKGVNWEDLVPGELTEHVSLVATSLELSCPSADFYEYCFLSACGK